MVIIEVSIGIIPANFLHITMVGYTFPTQGFLKKLFEGVFKDKLHLKNILIIFIQACHHTLNQACHNILVTACHLILIQACHHTFCVHIAIILLCMHLMYFNTTLIYHL